MTQQHLSAGIDIGGTNVVLGLTTRNGTVLWKNTLSTKEYDTFETLVSACTQELSAALKNYPSHKLLGCGIGAPNGNFYTGNIEHAPNLKWKGIIPVADLFQKSLNIETIVTNDANAAAIGEMIYGGAKDLSDFIVITLGTGLGSGIVVNGDILYGHDGFAGEIGHVIVDKNGRQCGCGRRGCLETYCSATAIVVTYNELTKKSEENIDAHKIYDRALNGEAEAIEAFDLTGEILGLALANSVAYTSPQAIFLFGGLARSGNFLLTPTQKSFEKNLHNIYSNKSQILLSLLNENDAALLGASSLIWKRHE